jgi:hypothetical protein
MYILIKMCRTGRERERERKRDREEAREKLII